MNLQTVSSLTSTDPHLANHEHVGNCWIRVVGSLLLRKALFACKQCDDVL